MTRHSLLLSLLLGFATPCAFAEESTPSAESHLSPEAMRKELTALIESQLAAFRANDYVKAYTFAADEIRTQYTLVQFERMVKGRYPVIARWEGVEFGLVLDKGDTAVVNVKLRSPRGTLRYEYHLMKQKDGWRIGGVAEIKSEGLSV